MIAALWAETRKLRRSALPGLTALALTGPAVVAGLFMLVVRGSRGDQGLLGDKAEAFQATADWPGYFALLLQIDAAGGLLVFGILTAWVFGREFSDRTVADLLALPTSRTAIVLAKFVVVLAWAAALSALVLIAGLLVGGALGLPGWSAALLAGTIRELALLSALTAVLVTPIGLVASVGRGYLPAVGVLLLVTVLANVLAAVGLGAWFPWSVPALASGIAGTAGAVGAASYLLVGVVALAGGGLTIVWWRTAEFT